MKRKKLNLYAQLPSIRRISGKLEKTKPVFVVPDQSFDQISEPASIPFVWEKIPGKPKDDISTLVQKSTLLETDEKEEDLDTVSSNGTFSINCSTSGVSDIEKSELSRESLDLMMSRFFPAEAMTFTHQKRSSEEKQTLQNREALVTPQRSQVVAEYDHLVVVQSLYDDLNIDDDDEVDHRIYQEVTIKKASGFLPRLCAKYSFKISNLIPSVSRSNRGLKYHRLYGCAESAQAHDP